MSGTEHEAHREADLYWQDDVALCEATLRYLRGSPTTVRAKVHVSEERFSSDDVHPEIVPLTHTSGERSYILMKPYVLEPEITLTVGVYPNPTSDQTYDQAMGEVLSSAWEGMRHKEVGHIQAWHYPKDRTLVLWECYFNRPFRDQPLLQDENMRNLWMSTERFLLDRFSGRCRLLTPFRDPEFPDDEYQQFLRELGFQSVAKAAYGKHRPTTRK